MVAVPRRRPSSQEVPKGTKIRRGHDNVIRDLGFPRVRADLMIEPTRLIEGPVP